MSSVEDATSATNSSDQFEQDIAEIVEAMKVRHGLLDELRSITDDLADTSTTRARRYITIYRSLILAGTFLTIAIPAVVALDAPKPAVVALGVLAVLPQLVVQVFNIRERAEDYHSNAAEILSLSRRMHRQYRETTLEVERFFRKPREQMSADELRRIKDDADAAHEAATDAYYEFAHLAASFRTRVTARQIAEIQSLDFTVSRSDS